MSDVFTALTITVSATTTEADPDGLDAFARAAAARTLPGSPIWPNAYLNARRHGASQADAVMAAFGACDLEDADADSASWAACQRPRIQGTEYRWGAGASSVRLFNALGGRMIEVSGPPESAAAVRAAAVSPEMGDAYREIAARVAPAPAAPSRGSWGT